MSTDKYKPEDFKGAPVPYPKTKPTKDEVTPYLLRPKRTQEQVIADILNRGFKKP